MDADDIRKGLQKREMMRYTVRKMRKAATAVMDRLSCLSASLNVRH